MSRGDRSVIGGGDGPNDRSFERVQAIPKKLHLHEVETINIDLRAKIFVL